MEYLILDPTMPTPYGDRFWSLRIEVATQFPSVDAANAARDAALDATNVIVMNDEWYVVKE